MGKYFPFESRGKGQRGKNCLSFVHNTCLLISVNVAIKSSFQ